jgi:uridylate kinase
MSVTKRTGVIAWHSSATKSIRLSHKDHVTIILINTNVDGTYESDPFLVKET